MLVLVYSPLRSTTGVPKVFWIFSVSMLSSGMSSAKLMMVSVESNSRRGASSDSSPWVLIASSSSAEVEVSVTMLMTLNLFANVAIANNLVAVVAIVAGVPITCTAMSVTSVVMEFVEVIFVMAMVTVMAVMSSVMTSVMSSVMSTVVTMMSMVLMFIIWQFLEVVDRSVVMMFTFFIADSDVSYTKVLILTIIFGVTFVIFFIILDTGRI